MWDKPIPICIEDFTTFFKMSSLSILVRIFCIYFRCCQGLVCIDPLSLCWPFGVPEVYPTTILDRPKQAQRQRSSKTPIKTLTFFLVPEIVPFNLMEYNEEHEASTSGSEEGINIQLDSPPTLEELVPYQGNAVVPQEHPV